MLQTIKLLLTLLPVIIDAVKSVEAAIPESGKGNEKLSMVMNIIYLVGDKVEEVAPLIEKVIGIVVTTFNTVGVFKKA